MYKPPFRLAPYTDTNVIIWCSLQNINIRLYKLQEKHETISAIFVDRTTKIDDLISAYYHLRVKTTGHLEMIQDNYKANAKTKSHLNSFILFFIVIHICELLTFYMYFYHTK